MDSISEKAWGMPSGHSQNAVVFCSLLAHSLQTLPAKVLALIFICAIAISRMYLGLHFPDQVIIGLTMGITIVLVWVNLEATFISFLMKQSFLQQIVVIFYMYLLFWLEAVFISCWACLLWPTLQEKLCRKII